MTLTTPLNPWPYVMGSWPDPEAEASVDAFEALGYEPNCIPRLEARERGEDIPPCGLCPQERFHAATEDDVLYGGAAGGGKTLALLMEGLRACVRYPGIWTGAYRRTFDEHNESFLKALAHVAYAEDLGATWNKNDRELTFPVRAGRVSKMRFRYAERLEDASRRQGGDYQLLLIDEGTLMGPGVTAILQERLRSADPAIPVLGTRRSANPGGQSHTEIKQRFIEPTRYGEQVITDDAGRTVRFIPAKLDDNPHLARDAGYRRTLDAIADPARRKAMKDGDWDVFVGQFFEEWNRERHVLKPFTIPAGWERHAGVDYGYRHAWVALYGAWDADGRCWVYRELDGTKVGQSAQAQRILEAEAEERVEARHAGHDFWAKTGEHNTTAEIYAEAGVELRRAVTERVNGWARVHEYLTEAPACELHRAMDWETCPLLHIFSTCEDTVRTVPTAIHDPKKPEDLLKVDGDDWLDALRYLVMGRGAPSTPVGPDELEGTNEWDMGPSMADAGHEEMGGGGGYGDYGR